MVKTVGRLVAVAITAILTVIMSGAFLSTAQAAQTLPFSPRFSANANGSIIIIGNNVVTCPPSALDCLAARAGDIYMTNNSFEMINLDADDDSSTFNSSMSRLELPNGAQVLWAGLYWGGDIPSSLYSSDVYKRMSLRAPGDDSYRTIQASTLGDAIFGPNTENSSSNYAYQRFADVTDIVREAGDGDYWGANVRVSAGGNGFGGWSLVVAYSAPGLPLRNLTVFDGYDIIGRNKLTETITVDGFLTPLTGDVNASLGMVVYEGDGMAGVNAYLNDVALSTDLSPAKYFFNSRNDLYGVSAPARTPADVNMFGFDIKNLRVEQVIPNGETSATFRFESNNPNGTDVYYPGVVAFAIDQNAPDFSTSTKTALNLSGHSPAQPGDKIEYTINFINTGQDAASDVVSEDVIPAGARYVPGSLKLLTGPDRENITPLSDAGGDDVGEFTGTAVRVRLGDAATASNGGRIEIDHSMAYSFQVELTADSAGTTVNNTAHLDYLAATVGIGLAYHTKPVSVPVSSHADVSIVKAMSPRTAVNGELITSTITVTNHGPMVASGIQVKDVIPDGWMVTTPDVWDAPAGTSCEISAPPATPEMVCTLPDMAAGASAVIRLSGTMSPDTADSQTTLTNTASVTTTTLDQNQSNNQSTDTISLVSKADLSVTIAGSTTGLPLSGDRISYTIELANAGPSLARNVSLQDSLPAGLTIDPAAPPLLPPDAVCDVAPSAGGKWNCALGDLDPGDTRQIVVNTIATQDGAAAMVSTVTASSTTPDPVMVNNTASWTLSDAALADLAITATATTKSFPAGETGTYQLLVTNDGPYRTTATITDTLPAGLTLLPAGAPGSQTSPECAAVAQLVTCLNPDPLESGAIWTVRLTVAVDPGFNDGDVLLNTGHVFGTTTDPVSANNSSLVVVPVIVRANLVVEAMDWQAYAGPDNPPQAAVSSLTAGSQVWLTMTLSNSGPATAQAISLSLGHGVDLVAVESGPGPVVIWHGEAPAGDPDCVVAVQAVYCPLNNGKGSLLTPGETVTFSVLFAARGDNVLPKSTSAWLDVSTVTVETDLDDNHGQAPLEILEAPVPSVQVTKFVDPPDPVVLAGADLIHTLTFTNTGTGPGVVDHITDLTDLLDDAHLMEIDASSTVSLRFDPVTRKLFIQASLAAGETVTVTYHVRVKVDFTRGDGVLFDATFPADTPLADRPALGTPQQDCSLCTTTKVAALWLDKSAVSARLTSSMDQIEYGFTVINLGAVPLTDLTINEIAFTGHGPLPQAVCPTAPLLPGATAICTLTYPVASGDLDLIEILNTATATAAVMVPDSIPTPGAGVQTVTSTPIQAVVQVEPPGALPPPVKISTGGQVVTPAKWLPLKALVAVPSLLTA